VHLVGFIVKKFVTMQGHANVEFFLYCTTQNAMKHVTCKVKVTVKAYGRTETDCTHL
jgi:hypothetical protein